MSEEEIEKALDEIFKEDTQTIRESMASLIRSYDNALGELVESDKKINELQKENEEKDKIKIVKKGKNAYDVLGIPGTSSYENYKEAAKKVSKHIDKLQKENQELKEEIREFIKKELPDNEIMECCSNYDVNGVAIRKELEKILADKE